MVFILDKANYHLPAPSTTSYRLLLLTALSGEFPIHQVDRLGGGRDYLQVIVTKLKRQNLIRAYRRDNVIGLRLTLPCKRLFLRERPAEMAPFVTGKTETNHPRSELTRRLRLHRMAEVLTPMANAGVVFTPWEKPPIFREKRVYPADVLPHSAYYTSKEVKKIGSEARIFTSSRFTGILFTPDGIFLAYNARDGNMLWEYRAEIRLKNVIFTELCQNRLQNKYTNSPINGLMFGTTMEAMVRVMTTQKKGRRNYFVLDSSFDHFFFLPNDQKGDALLRLLCSSGLQAELNELLREDLAPADPGLPIENDAIDQEGKPVLFAYLCDLPRIQRFITGLEIHNRPGALVCFDFQKEVMRQICGDRVSINSIIFEKFQEVYLSTEKSGSA